MVRKQKLAMNEYQLDPNVCPSSLDENGLPMTEGNTAHKWDDTTCSECGAFKKQTITIEVSGGVVTNVSGLEDNQEYVLLDHDNE